MDEFDLDARIEALETSYSAVVAALQRSRLHLQTLRGTLATQKQIASAEARCQELEKKRAAIQHLLDELENGEPPHPPGPLDRVNRSIEGR